MWSKVYEVADSLTPSEISALEELDRGSIRRSIPSADAKRLLQLGLTEVSFGRLALTIAGRHVLEALDDKDRELRSA
jgi:hypothetical protein